MVMKNGNYSIRHHSIPVHMALSGLAGERYTSHQAVGNGKDSNRGWFEQEPEHEPPVWGVGTRPLNE